MPVRIGVNRGHVFAGDIGPAYRRTYTVMGDAVNLAARVMAKAEPGQVLATTEVLERSQVAVRTVAAGAVHGQGQGEAGAGVRARRDRGRGSRPSRRSPQQIVRRSSAGSDELAVLREGLEGPGGAGRVIEIVGEPGIGKSRLLEEVRTMAAGFSTWGTACDAYQASTPYFAFRRPLRRLSASAATSPRTTGRDAPAFVHGRNPELEPRLPLLAVPFGWR